MSVIEIFPQTKANCVICGEETNGKFKIGDDYYCEEDWGYITEKPENKKQDQKVVEFKKIFKPL